MVIFSYFSMSIPAIADLCVKLSESKKMKRKKVKNPNGNGILVEEASK